MKLRRKLERDGQWWAQARDGSWVLWDAAANDWVPQLSGPPGGVAPLEPEGAVPTVPPAEVEWDHGSAVWYFVKTWGGTALPGLLVFGLAMVTVVPITLLWNVFFVPWLTEAIDLVDVLLLLLGATVAATGFFSLASTVGKFVRPPLGWVLGGLTLLGGTVLTFWGVSVLSGVPVGVLLRSRETAMTACVIAAGWLFVSLRRWMQP